jgi:hypothetical protein
MFPYKNLPSLKETPSKTNTWVLIRSSEQQAVSARSKACRVPSDGNIEQKERAWTDAEKKKLDEF